MKHCVQFFASCFFALCSLAITDFHTLHSQTTLDSTQRTSTTKTPDGRKEYVLPDRVIVTGSRLPNDGANPRHTVQVVSRPDIERSTARSVEELLENIAGVDIRQRGQFGVQADVSIRGGTFEQTLLLIDGVKMIDPQTGHHNFNIPLTLDDIERVEVLKGPGSRQYGPNAFNGAINIITRKHKETFARVQLMGGENALWEASLSGGLPVQLSSGASLNNRFSVMRRRSDGYRLNTDFDITTVSGAVQFAAQEHFSLEATANYVEKKFGANSFYSLRFPTQYEETRTLLTTLTAKADVGVPITATAYWRRNNDNFVLRRENPAFYQNLHASNTYGAEAQTVITSTLGATAVGGEAAADMLESTNLGNRQRTRLSIFAEHQWKPVQNVTVELGATALWNSDWGWNVSPGVDIGWQATDNLRLYGSAGQSFRVPTYTELFYRDPSNIGDSTLKPEQAWTFELGGVVREGSIEARVALFRRNATQLIDYVRSVQDPATAPWRARNISTGVTNGADIQLTWFANRIVSVLERVQATYTYLDPTFSTEPGLQSSYVLQQLRHQAALTADILLFGGLRNQWRVRYEQRLGASAFLTDAPAQSPRVGSSDFVFVDTRLAWNGGAWEVFAEATNLGNTLAIDFNGLPLPGRWLRAGAAVNVAEFFK